MITVTYFSEGDRVRIENVEIERFKHEPGLLRKAANFIKKEAIVERVDEGNEIVWVKIDGEEVWFDPWDLEKIS